MWSANLPKRLSGMTIIEMRPELLVMTMTRATLHMQAKSDIGIRQGGNWVAAVADLGSDPNSVLLPPVDRRLSSELGSDPKSAGHTDGTSVCQPQWVSKNINNDSNQHRLYKR